jgi:prepilin-type N-terminal cleavage/methylation domain-containing protein
MNSSLFTIISRVPLKAISYKLKALQFRPAFTALELILVLAIFAITAGATLPFLGHFQTTGTLKTHGQDIVQTLRRAQHRAAMGQRDKAWGVYFTSGQYVLYAGNSYAGRDSDFDESHTVGSAYSFTGSGELTFRKLTGAAMTGGTVTVTHGDAGSKSVDVSAAGSISLQ